MPRLSRLKAGSVVWVPCELKSGIFPTEQGVKIQVNIGGQETIFGFIPTADIRPGEAVGRGYVRAVVMQTTNGKVAILFRGDIMSQSNPVVVPREWLEEVALPEA